MIPIKKHVEVLQRFDKEYKVLIAKIDKIDGEHKGEEFNEEGYKLRMRFMEFIRFWENIDDFIELKVEPFLNKEE